MGPLQCTVGGLKQVPSVSLKDTKRWFLTQEKTPVRQQHYLPSSSPAVLSTPTLGLAFVR